MKLTKIILIVILLLTGALGTVYAQEDDEKYVIGNYIFVGDEAFRAEMAELGYIEGENTTYLYVTYDYELSQEEWQVEYERQIKAMIDAGVDIFVVNTDTDALNLRLLVGDIPIVFARSDDPVASGAVADLTNPGGTMTGNITSKPGERRLELLTEIDPTTKVVYYIYSAYFFGAEKTLQQVQLVADELGVELVPAMLGDASTIPDIMKNIPEDVDWIFFTPYSFLGQATTEELLAICAERNAGLAWITADPVQGYLMGYGPDMNSSGRQAAQIVDRILRGANPADLPVLTVENTLMINLEAAEALNIEVPESILRQADVIVRPGYFDNLETETPGD